MHFLSFHLPSSRHLLSHIGLRPTQEDRFVLVPKFFRPDCAFCGVFDGTVGDDASEFINTNIVTHLCNNLNVLADSEENIFNTTNDKAGAGDIAGVSDEVAEKLRDGLRNTFLSADRSLLELCTENKLHYASSTGVTALLFKNLLTVAHIGDSKACIARIHNNEIHPEWLTVDHKPDMPIEVCFLQYNNCIPNVLIHMIGGARHPAVLFCIQPDTDHNHLSFSFFSSITHNFHFSLS
jgi:serine/threonine protein phosphatase PrpC